MSRPCKCRRICFNPDVCCFKPTGIPLDKLEEVSVTFDELEALRLADLNEMFQEHAAKKMNVSRQTFGNIISSAHKKIADFLINVKALKVEGGNVKLVKNGRDRRVCRDRHLKCARKES